MAVDLRNVDALLTMLKNLDDQESAGHLMIAANQVRLAAEMKAFKVFYGFVLWLSKALDNLDTEHWFCWFVVFC